MGTGMTTVSLPESLEYLPLSSNVAAAADAAVERRARGAVRTRFARPTASATRPRCSLTVAQELSHVPSTSASPGGGRLHRPRRDRRVHTHDATDRNAIAERGGKNRQRYRRAHELGARDGDAFELGTAPCCGSTQPEWPICGEHWQLYQHRQHHGRRYYGRGYRYDEGEDALTRCLVGAGRRRASAPLRSPSALRSSTSTG